MLSEAGEMYFSGWSLGSQYHIGLSIVMAISVHLSLAEHKRENLIKDSMTTDFFTRKRNATASAVQCGSFLSYLRLSSCL